MGDIGRHPALDPEPQENRGRLLRLVRYFVEKWRLFAADVSDLVEASGGIAEPVAIAARKWAKALRAIGLVVLAVLAIMRAVNKL